ncbi:MAG: glycosyltransferase family protein [Patescibacteria group bacterium]
MNIVYTVNGENMGHATRSSVVIEHLLSRGHRVSVFSSGSRPVEYLRAKFDSVARVTGLHMVYRNNKVQRLRTALRALSGLTRLRKDLTEIKRTLADFHPEVVITDFDFHGEIISRLHRIPVICIDNIQFLRYAKFPIETEDFLDYELNLMVARMMVPRADHFLITSFVDPELRNGANDRQHIFFVPPPLRERVLAAPRTTGEHVLVYQSSDSYDRMLPLLAQSGARFVIYNSRRTVKAPNLQYKDFDENGFIDDMASAKGVITNGGFNVITESLFFRKPILSIPIKNFFEQKLNAQLLQANGLGHWAPRMSKKTLETFLSQASRSSVNSSAVVFDNQILFTRLDTALDACRRPVRARS